MVGLHRVQDGDQPMGGVVVDRGLNKDDRKMKEDDLLESGSDEEHLKDLDDTILSGVDNSIRERDVPDSCLSGGQEGVSRNTPESGTCQVTTFKGDLVVNVMTPTASQTGLARCNVFQRGGQFVDDDAVKTPVVICVPDTSSDEGMLSDDDMVKKECGEDQSPQRSGEDDDDLIPRTPTPSISRRRNYTDKPSNNISGKNLEILFTNNTLLERPGDNNTGGDVDIEESGIEGAIPPLPTDDIDVGGGPGSGDQPVRREAGAIVSGISVGAQSYAKRDCQFERGDHCTIHGGGAVMKFRGGSRLVRGRGGKMVKRYQRGEKYYVCDLARGGRGGKGTLVQTTLSFKVTGSELMRSSASVLEDSISEGQGSGCTNHGERSDEKGTDSR